MLPRFESFRAQSKREVLSFLTTMEEVKILAGGTDLMVKMRRGELCARLLDVSEVDEIRGVAENSEEIIIGSGVTHRRVSEDGLVKGACPSLAVACGAVGSPQIRNMGTLGGNLVNASPAADSLPPLLIHDALLTLETQDNQRKERLEDFIVKPYETTIKANELLSAIHISPLKGYREGYRRVTKRSTWAISRLSVAWAIHEEEDVFRDVRLAIGSCTPMPFRATKVENFLKGAKKTEQTITDALYLVLDGILAMSGERPSYRYKFPVLKGMLSEILRG